MSDAAPLFPPPGSHDELELGTRLTPRFDAAGLVTAVVTEFGTGQVLMLAHMNADALARTIATGIATYWSRSRGALWVKGETSGNLQRVKALRVDCDQDAVWLEVTVDGHGASCHRGYHSCFYRSVAVGGAPDAPLAFDAAGPAFDPASVYGSAGHGAHAADGSHGCGHDHGGPTGGTGGTGAR